MGLKSDGRYPDRRKAEGDFRHSEKPERELACEQIAAQSFATFVKGFRYFEARCLFSVLGLALRGKAHLVALSTMVALSEPISCTVT